MSANPFENVRKLVPAKATIETHGPQLHFGLRMALIFADRILPELESTPMTISTVRLLDHCGLMFVAPLSGHALQVIGREGDGMVSLCAGNIVQFSAPYQTPSADCKWAFSTEDEIEQFASTAIAYLQGAGVVDFPRYFSEVLP